METTTVRQQAATFMTQIQTRRRQPVRSATVKSYQSHLTKWVLPLLGDKDLSQIENGAVKNFIQKLSEAGLSAPSITKIFTVVKMIVASAVDENGNELYPRKWNHEFVDLPVVNPADQDAPTVPLVALETALVRAKGADKALYAILAGTGVRIGEALSLMVGPDDGRNSFWQPETATLTIRTTLTSHGIQDGTKTQAGQRQVDLAPDLNTFLSTMLLDNDLPSTGLLFRSQTGGPFRIQTAYEHLQKVGIDEGFHSFRRFRITHLESQNVPKGLQMFWTGHAAGDVHESYIKMGSNLEVRKDWAKKAGLGFQLGVI